MKISVVGLGKLGLPFATLLSRAGNTVIGIDLDLNRLKNIEELVIESEPQVKNLVESELSHNFRITSNWKTAIEDSEISFIIVPTPSDGDGNFKNDYVIQALYRILENVNNSNHIVCVVSTVMPETCQKILSPIIERYNSDQNLNTKLAYSPEFIALGTIVKNMEYPDLILVGEDESFVGDKLISVLKSISKNSPIICRMSLTSAELTKLAINTYVTSKISFANMIAEIADALDGANKLDVLKAVGSDSRVGYAYLKPGLGFGGPCFPRDNRAMGAIAASLGIDAEIPHATQSINLRQPRIQTNKIINKIGNNPKNILFLGLSYKPGSYVTEESQALMIATLLASHQHNVYIHDPLAILKGESIKDTGLTQIQNLDDLDFYEHIIIAVDWPEYDEIKKNVDIERLILIY